MLEDFRKAIQLKKKKKIVCLGFFYILQLPPHTVFLHSEKFTHPNCTYSYVYCNHRRRIELEDKAKVVASVWGTESLQR